MPVINGTIGADTLNGTTGPDEISGLEGSDVIDGSDGNDFIVGGPGDDHLSGGSGEDAIGGGSGSDWIDGGDGNDLLHDGAGKSSMFGGDGDDSIQLGYSNEGGSEFQVEGGTGNDVISLQGLSQGIVDGGSGIDTAGGDWSAWQQGIHWDLKAGTYSGPGSWTGIELIAATMTAGNDYIVTSSADLDDSVHLGQGDDSVSVTRGRDAVTGGAGIDTLIVDWGTSTTRVIEGVYGIRQSTDGGWEGQYVAPEDSTRRVYFEGIECFVITTGSGDDRIITKDGDDEIYTGDGKDFIDPGLGVNIVDGGDGTDSITMDMSSVEESIHWNLSTNTYSGPGHLSNIEIAISLALGIGSDEIVTSYELGFDPYFSSYFFIDDFVDCGPGNDTVTVFNGSDRVIGGMGGDALVIDYRETPWPVRSEYYTDSENSDPWAGRIYDYNASASYSYRNVYFNGVERFVITSGSADDVLTTLGGDDTVLTGDGNDIVHSAGGNDSVDGGAGNDVLEGGAGFDVLSGSPGNDVLNGGVGADTLTGGGGNDTYIVDNVGDQVIESSAAGGVDLVQSSVSFTLSVNVEDLNLTHSANVNGTGNGLANLIVGNSGANQLNGGAGADEMRGGAGNDVYVIDNVGDQAIEISSAHGVDLVYASVSYTLGAKLEDLTLTGAGAINATGNAAANILTGNGASNVLNGAAGADTMSGGSGNDTYLVDNIFDQAVESGAAGGTDKVNASVSFTLGAYVENLTLVGTAAVNATGNGLSNLVTGNTAANILDGGVGVDIMQGGAGNDTYVVDNVGDQAMEVSASHGTDTVQASVNFKLSAKLENLTLTGTGAIDGTGNAAGNVITGNGAKNFLDGGAGSDTLFGGGGADRFVFANSPGATNVDTILDFAPGSDKLLLDDGVFTALAAGALPPGALVLGSAATDANDRILYDAATGALFYDRDGTGAAAAIQFAVLDTHPANLTAGDFLVI